MPRTPRPRLAISLLVALLAGLVVAGCAAAAPTPSPTAIAPAVTPTPVPGAPGAGGGSSGGSGSAPGGGSGGGVVPPGPGDDPLDGDATFVSPIPGQLDPHPVNVQAIRASVDGRHVQVELRWWSGVAPCSVLDSVQVARSDGDRTIGLTVIQGAGARDVACIDIAQLTATVVDLGDLEPGSWTIRAAGDAAPVVVDIR